METFGLVVLLVFAALWVVAGAVGAFAMYWEELYNCSWRHMPLMDKVGLPTMLFWTFLLAAPIEFYWKLVVCGYEWMADTMQDAFSDMRVARRKAAKAA